MLSVILLFMFVAMGGTTMYPDPQAVDRSAPYRAPFEKQVLVILDTLKIKSTHNIFFTSLESNGFNMTYQKVDDPNLKIFHFGTALYSSIVLFAPTASDFAGDVNVDALLEFIDEGHNLVLVACSTLSDQIKEIADECGAIFAEEGTHVIDHMQLSSLDSGEHTTVVSREYPLPALDVVLGSCRGPLVFRGVAHTLDDVSSSSLNLPLAAASRSSYSAEPEAQGSAASSFGTQTMLLSALQARNNARVVICGSLDFYSDEFFWHKVSGETVCNSQLAVNSALWAFQARGVLKVHSASHGPTEALVDQEQGVYRVGQNITYQIRLLQRESDGSWEPYVADDVYLDVAMLDPYIRVRLQHSSDGYYRTRLQLPDVKGIFSFRVDYHHRLGYSRLFRRDIVSIRPFRHDEFERFIGSAYPYYASAFSMMLGVLVFSCVFLFHRDNPNPHGTQ